MVSLVCHLGGYAWALRLVWQPCCWPCNDPESEAQPELVVRRHGIGYRSEKSYCCSADWVTFNLWIPRRTHKPSQSPGLLSWHPVWWSWARPYCTVPFTPTPAALSWPPSRTVKAPHCFSVWASLSDCSHHDLLRCIYCLLNVAHEALRAWAQGSGQSCAIWSAGVGPGLVRRLCVCKRSEGTSQGGLQRVASVFHGTSASSFWCVFLVWPRFSFIFYPFNRWFQKWEASLDF